MNYEEFIERALLEGESPEQIAAAISEALNKKEQERKAENAKTARRKQYLDDLYYQVFEDADRDPLSDYAAAAALATLVAADRKRNWTIEQLEEYRKTAVEQLESIVTVLEWCNEFTTKLEDAVNKSKEKVEKKEKKASAAPIGKSSDKEVIEEFLKRLGL